MPAYNTALGRVLLASSLRPNNLIVIGYLVKINLLISAPSSDLDISEFKEF